MSLKISITTEPNEFSNSRKPCNCPRIVLKYFVLRFMSWDVFKIIFLPINIELLDARGIAASCPRK